MDVSNSSVFLIWDCPAAGFDQVTDTFLFDDDFKIINQNVVVKGYQPQSTQEAWNNHFAAFGGSDLDKIMLDYTDTSVVRTYDFASPEGYVVHEGLHAISLMFVKLFSDLGDKESLVAPVIDVHDNTVFLVWAAPNNGVQWATDTFEFDEDTHRIQIQNLAGLFGDSH